MWMCIFFFLQCSSLPASRLLRVYRYSCPIKLRVNPSLSSASFYKDTQKVTVYIDSLSNSVLTSHPPCFAGSRVSRI